MSNKNLPSKYYLKAVDPKFAAMTQGVVFSDIRTPWAWLFRQAKRDVSKQFTLEVVDEVYYGSNLLVDFK